MQETYELIKQVFFLLDDGDRCCLRQYDLTPVQYYTLLWSNSADGKTLGELSEKLLCTRSNVTRVVDRMVRRGLLTRERDHKDRRVVRVSLTPAGQQLYREASQAHSESIIERINTLPEAEQATLRQSLGTLRSSLQAQLAESPVIC